MLAKIDLLTKATAKVLLFSDMTKYFFKKMHIGGHFSQKKAIFWHIWRSTGADPGRP
jgi:hypothetical protein